MVDGINYLKRLRVPLSEHLKQYYPGYQSIRMGVSYHMRGYDNGDYLDKTLIGKIHAFLVPKNGHEYKELATMVFSAKNHKDFIMEARSFAKSLISG